MPVVKLTQELINNELVCPDGQRKIELVDEGRTGLYLLITASSQGVGTYYLRYKNNQSKTCHQKIARTTDMTLREAKSQVHQLRSEIAQGSDPRARAKAKKKVPLFSEFFEDEYMPHAKLHKRSWDSDLGLYSRHLKRTFGHLRLNQITRGQVQSLHSTLRESGLSAASCDHYAKLVRHVLNVAVNWEVIDKNAVSRVTLFNEDNKVNHYLDENELGHLLAVLKTDPNQGACRVIKFLLSTGARLNEALKAEWEHIDRVNRVWVIPASNSKSKRVRSIPLNDSALSVLDELDTEGEFEHLFINPYTKKRLTTIQKGWRTIRSIAGLPNMRLHDLRHQYASNLINSGRTLYEVQQILGHSDPKVTQRYAHLSTKSLQAAANSASDCMTAALKKVS